jgi:hypothetical protein
MLKKVLAFLLLIHHMNTSMFLPQMAEQDRYDSAGVQYNDINSVVEFIDDLILDYNDDVPMDEDDDNGQNFHMVKMVDYSYTPFLTATNNKANLAKERRFYIPTYNDSRTEPGFPNVLLDPPKTAISC